MRGRAFSLVVMDPGGFLGDISFALCNQHGLPTKVITQWPIFNSIYFSHTHTHTLIVSNKTVKSFYFDLQIPFLFKISFPFTFLLKTFYSKMSS